MLKCLIILQRISSQEMSMDKNRMISYGDAIYEACAEEMKKDKSVVVYGLDVDDP